MGFKVKISWLGIYLYKKSQKKTERAGASVSQSSSTRAYKANS